MKTNTRIHYRSRALWIAFALLCLSTGSLSAEQFGLFTYRVVGDTIEIADYPTTEVGEVEIPAEIDGKPVTSIGGLAFWDCSGLTGVTIPETVTNIAALAFSGCSGLTEITIPSSVTSIGGAAFEGCSGLTDVTIPASVTSIGPSPFLACTSLASIEVDGGNRNYASNGGVLFSATMDALLLFPEGKAGHYNIPASVTSIGHSAFKFCSGLTGITMPEGVIEIGDQSFDGCVGLTDLTIPEGVTRIGVRAFQDCNRLTHITFSGSFTSISTVAFASCGELESALFLGDTPPEIGGSVFAGASSSFTIYYLSGSSGFTSPTWEGYPSVMIDEAAYPAAKWLLEHGLAHDADLHQDFNGDGVSLLMAYALDLDPYQHLQNSLPSPALDADTQTLSLSFHGASPGITYTVETSTDLQNWTTDEVTLSGMGGEGHRTATVVMDLPRRFLRLVVEE